MALGAGFPHKGLASPDLRPGDFRGRPWDFDPSRAASIAVEERRIRPALPRLSGAAGGGHHQAPAEAAAETPKSLFDLLDELGSFKARERVFSDSRIVSVLVVHS